MNVQTPVCLVGVHRPHWVGLAELDAICVSRSSMASYRRLPGPVAVRGVLADSGAFTEIRRHGRWTMRPEAFAWWVMLTVDWLGDRLIAVSPPDWMCEPDQLARTGLQAETHLALTVEWFCAVRAALDARYRPLVLPVLQGWTVDEYTLCWSMYEQAGVDLEDEPLVGVGSVCRRNDREGIGQAAEVLTELSALRLHAFGANAAAVDRAIAAGTCAWDADGQLTHGLMSYDSMAWSTDHRRTRIRLDGCTHAGDCRNCPRAAARYRCRRNDRAVAATSRYLAGCDLPAQLDLFGAAP